MITKINKKVEPKFNVNEKCCKILHIFDCNRI